MPGYGWSGPSTYPLGASSITVSSFTASTLGDISPYACPIPPGLLNLGTRIRLIAHGSYTGTSTTVTLQWGFYLNAPNTAIAGTVLGLSPAITVVSGTGIPWILEYFGHVAIASGAGAGTGASFVGRGRFTTAAQVGGAFNASQQVPQTLAAVTVAQSSGTAGSTILEQNVQLGLTPGASVTNLTNVITDELTCELIG